MSRLNCRRPRRLGLILAVATIVASSCLADLTDWNGYDVLSVFEPGGDSTGPDSSMDITGLRYRLDNGTNYFRMDLAEAPDIGPYNSAPDYQILLDFAPGGASPLLSSYVPNDGAGGLSGIDSIVDMNFALFGFQTEDYHTYAPGNPPVNFSTVTMASVGGLFQRNGTILEWALPSTVGGIGTSAMTIYGAAMYINELGGPLTWDFTGPIHTPEPATLALFGVVCGVVALGLRRRKA